MDKSNQDPFEYRALGVMSGSSLDGLDVCLVCFREQSGWSFELEASITFEIPKRIVEHLSVADSLRSNQLLRLDVEYGEWIGLTLKDWLSSHTAPNVIGVHGHTVFHQPEHGFSLQIGSGQVISEKTNIPTVDDFRTRDILLGGQGAPLVAFGEKELFRDFSSFINLGGIANISIHDREILAWDVAPCNQVFNHLALKKGKPFDHNGDIAKSGTLDQDFLGKLDRLAYFSAKPPKSLSNQWTSEVLKLLPENVGNAMHTYAHFLGRELAQAIKGNTGQALITGGGAYNTFLIDQIKEHLDYPEQIVIPDSSIVEYKEAIVFAFMGLFRTLNRTNVLRSVTGARRDSISGTLHQKG